MKREKPLRSGQIRARPIEVGSVKEVCYKRSELKSAGVSAKNSATPQKFERFIFEEISALEHEFRKEFLPDLGEIDVQLRPGGKSIPKWSLQG